MKYAVRYAVTNDRGDIALLSERDIDTDLINLDDTSPEGRAHNRVVAEAIIAAHLVRLNQGNQVVALHIAAHSGA